MEQNRAVVSFLIVENEPVMTAHARSEVERIYPTSTILDARTVRAAVEQIRTAGAPDWLLLDLGLPDARGIDALLALRPLAPEAKIIVISGSDDQEVREGAMHNGAFAFISKEFEVEAQFEALKLVLLQNIPVTPPPTKKRESSAHSEWAGGLTKTEHLVLDRLREGLTNKQIAQRMHISEATVKKHVVRIYRRAGLDSYAGNKRSALLARLVGGRPAEI